MVKRKYRFDKDSDDESSSPWESPPKKRTPLETTPQPPKKRTPLKTTPKLPIDFPLHDAVHIPFQRNNVVDEQKCREGLQTLNQPPLPLEQHQQHLSPAEQLLNALLPGLEILIHNAKFPHNQQQMPPNFYETFFKARGDFDNRMGMHELPAHPQKQVSPILLSQGNCISNGRSNHNSLVTPTLNDMNPPTRSSSSGTAAFSPLAHVPNVEPGQSIKTMANNEVATTRTHDQHNGTGFHNPPSFHQRGQNTAHCAITSSQWPSDQAIAGRIASYPRSPSLGFQYVGTQPANTSVDFQPLWTKIGPTSFLPDHGH